MKQLTRTQIRRELFETLEVPPRLSRPILTVIINAIAEALIQGRTVYLEGLGHLEVREWKARGFKPYTVMRPFGPMTVKGKPRDTVTLRFRPAKDLITRIKASYIAGNFKPLPRNVNPLSAAYIAQQKEKLERLEASRKKSLPSTSESIKGD